MNSGALRGCNDARPRRRRPRGESLAALLLPLAVAVIGILIFFARDGLDERIVDPFYDPETGRWPLKGAFWTGTFLHVYGKDFIILVAVSAVGVLLLARRFPGLGPGRRSAAYLFLSIVLSVLIVGFLKYTSVIPCPWSALRYGGDIPHLGVFAPVPEGTRAGHCFPGAHAAGGFSLMCCYYILRERSLRAAWVGLAFGALIGTAFSVGQVLRGAHFPSHNLWSLLLAWSIVSALYWIGFQGRLWRAPDASSTSSTRP